MSASMHRVCWRPPAGDSPTTWLARDGLLRLNQSARETLGAFGIALANHRALLLRSSEPVPLRDNAPLAAGDGELIWTREPVRPDPLPFAATGTTAEDSVLTQQRFALVGENIHHPLERDGEHEGGNDILLIGRHRCCQVQLTDERISAVHCAVVAEAGGVRIIDLDSRNGTFVDSNRCRVTLVNRRTTIEVGRTRLSVEPREATREALVALPSAAMARIYDTVARIAPADAPVVLMGESGTGKEGIARSIHAQSGRHGRFIALNAAVLTHNLAGSELFGHVRGAFTGADEDRQGAFVAADGGTLFLDEVAELRPDVQAELLRVLEAKCVRPIGATHSIPIDVRLVTATHRDLAARVQQGAFRADLFHRIWVLPITLPPLRIRPDDLDVLCDDFLTRQRPQRQLTEAARAHLLAHRWSGNIRELLNVLHRACVMTDAATLEPEHLQFSVASPRATDLEEMIRRNVIEAVQRHGGSIVAAARELGVHRSTVRRHIKAGAQSSAPAVECA